MASTTAFALRFPPLGPVLYVWGIIPPPWHVSGNSVFVRLRVKMSVLPLCSPSSPRSWLYGPSKQVRWTESISFFIRFVPRSFDLRFDPLANSRAPSLPRCQVLISLFFFFEMSPHVTRRQAAVLQVSPSILGFGVPFVFPLRRLIFDAFMSSFVGPDTVPLCTVTASGFPLLPLPPACYAFAL